LETTATARSHSAEVVARLREAVTRAHVDPGDTFELKAEMVPVARVMRLAGECGVDYLELFSIA
jgi:hypothetical protein